MIYRVPPGRWEGNVIKIRKYIIPNRYDSLHICSFFVFLEKTLDKLTKKCGEAL